jgi:hypothetical protein
VTTVVDPIWMRPSIITWSQWLLDSFQHWTGRELSAREGSAADQAKRLYMAPFVVLSHGMETDPILNYGNRAALELWETTWEQLTATASRQTAEPANQEERARLLRTVEERGYWDRYRGVRISTSGRRFLVEAATVWNVLDGQGRRVGQAATFSTWTRLE